MTGVNLQHPLKETDTFDQNPVQEGQSISDSPSDKSGQNRGDMLKLLMALLGGETNGLDQTGGQLVQPMQGSLLQNGAGGNNPGGLGSAG